MRLTRFSIYCIVILVLPVTGFCQQWKLYDSIAHAKIKNNDLQGAIQAYTKGLASDSNSYALYVGRAEAKLKMQDYKGAIPDFTKAISIFDDAGNYYQRGIAWYMLKNYKEAMADFDSTVSDSPEISYELYFFRGNIKFKLGDVKGSIDEYTRSIALKPGYAKAYYNRGVSKYFGDLKNEACADINKAKQLGFTDVDPLIKRYCDYYNTH